MTRCTTSNPCPERLGKTYVKIGSKIREVSPPENRSVEKKEIVSSQRTTGVQYSTTSLFTAAECFDFYNDIIFEGDVGSPKPAQIIEPLLVIRLAGIAKFLVRAAHRHDHCAAIHADFGLFGFHRLLKFHGKRLDSRLHEIALVEIQYGIKELFELFRLQIGRNLLCEVDDDLGTLRLGGLIVAADGHGLTTCPYADLNTIEDALLVLAAAIEFDFDLVIAESDIRNRHDLSCLDRLTVLFQIPIQLVLVQFARLG